MTKPRVPEFDAGYVRDISEAVYRNDLGPADVASMIDKDGDAGQKLRARAACYDTFTRTYLRVLKRPLPD
jgi:hypothetical protein